MRVPNGGFRVSRYHLFITAIVIFLITPSCGNHLEEQIDFELAAQSTREIRNAEMDYRQDYDTYADLPILVDEKLLDEKFRDGVDSGYEFRLEATRDRYTLRVTKQLKNGKHDPGQEASFYLDETGIVRESFDPYHPADAQSYRIRF
jgi:hypothetical protein